MDTTFRRTDLAAAMSSAALAITLTSPVSAVMVGGDDTGWEAGFNGSISGVDVSPEMDRDRAGAAMPGTAAGALANDEEGHRVKRAFCLSKRQNYLPGMSRVGVGLVGGSNWGTSAYALGDSAYVFPDYNARISCTTPNMRGCEVEIGRLDPNVAQNRFSGATGASLAAATQTDSPRFEGEASYVTSFRQDRFRVFPRGLWRAAPNPSVDLENKVTSWSVAGGITFGWSGLGLTFSRYAGEALGRALMFDEDALDGTGREGERQGGWLARAGYDFDGQTRLRGSYGRIAAVQTAAGHVDRGLAPLDEQKAWTVGFYHDVTSWLKLAAEYSKVEQRRLDDGKQDSDVFAIGGFFTW